MTANCGRGERDKQDRKQRGGGGGLVPWRWVVLRPSWKVSPRQRRVPSTSGLFTGWLVTVCLSSSAAAESLQLCLTLCDPIDGSPPGSPVPGILQARTRVGCHFLLQCLKVKGESEVAQSCQTQQAHGRQPTRLLCPWDSPGKRTGVGCHCLLLQHLLLIRRKWFSEWAQWLE